MRKKMLKLSALLLLVPGLTGLQAQTTITTTGGNASGSGGTVSYSYGQVVYKTNTGSNGTVGQGVQQPYEISVITAIEEAIGINLMVSAYPNPTNGYLTLEVDASSTLSFQSMCYRLFDNNGKLIESKNLESNLTNIVMNNFASATYFLIIIQGNNEVKTFKIIKN